jgi:alpha-N-arabinofuranosidase
MSVTLKAAGNAPLTVDPRPRFALPPYRFMQFMEPLGTTDSSVEAGWDFQHNCWREDLVRVTRELAPSLLRWPGGIFSSYYRWREGVGPRHARVPLLNILWGGVETNQVGTHEFVDFCRQVGAEPLIAVNFESDGKRRWSHPPTGEVRSAGPEEAADWVDYCNNPSNTTRKTHGAPQPFGVRLWQIGNETSYGQGGFDCETAAARTLAFARAMHAVDSDLALIGWGDSGWARRMLEVAGEELAYIAFHHHFNSGLENSPLQWSDYRRDRDETWRHLMHAYKSTEARIQEMREEVAGYEVSLALTESHFGLRGRNRCDVLATWAAGVAYARVLNVHARNGDILKIATLADFCGTRWMNNAVMIPTPQGGFESYMMPVARVMALYRHHSGDEALGVLRAPNQLDVAASRSGRRVYLHVVNTDQKEVAGAELQVVGFEIAGGRAFQIASEPMLEIDQGSPDIFIPEERAVPTTGIWQFPAASVTAIELDVVERPE